MFFIFSVLFLVFQTAPNAFYTRLTKMHIRKISLGGHILHTFHNIWVLQTALNVFYTKLVKIYTIKNRLGGQDIC